MLVVVLFYTYTNQGTFFYKHEIEAKKIGMKRKWNHVQCMLGITPIIVHMC